MTPASDEFEVRLATTGDEPEIRALAGAVAMPGSVTVSFAREPDYFLGASVMGDPCEVILVRRRRDGVLAGFACRGERRVFVDGTERRVGYIGQVRSRPEFRGRGLVTLVAGFIAGQGPPGLPYLGVVSRENPVARESLVGTRRPAGMTARHLTGLTSYSIILRRTRPPATRDLTVTPMREPDLDDVVAHLREQGPARQFFPVYTRNHFTGPALRGLAFEDVMVARRGGRIVGVLAAWDQSAFKQEVVVSYGPGLRRLRPLYDAAARLVGARPLTRVGDPIAVSFAALTCVSDDDPAVVRGLVSACARHAYDRGKAFLMLGLADDDPLLPVVARLPHITYRSDLYLLGWPAGTQSALPTASGRVPFIEIATL